MEWDILFGVFFHGLLYLLELFHICVCYLFPKFPEMFLHIVWNCWLMLDMGTSLVGVLFFSQIQWQGGTSLGHRRGRGTGTGWRWPVRVCWLCAERFAGVRGNSPENERLEPKKSPNWKRKSSSKLPFWWFHVNFPGFFIPGFSIVF